MNIQHKIGIALLGVIAMAATLPAQADWKSDVRDLINDGEFTSARAVIDALPDRVKADEPYAIDSALKIMSRIEYDFSVTPDKGAAMVRERRPETTDAELDRWVNDRYIEVKTIDGEQRWMRKAVRNLWLLNPDLVMVTAEDSVELSNYLECIKKIKNTPADANHCNNWQRITLRFSFTIEADAVPAGEQIHAWLPVPLASQRQRNFRLIDSNRPVIYSQSSPHHTVMMSATAEAGKPTHFEITLSYETAAQWFSRQYLLDHLKPYNTADPEYIKYTGSDGRHINITDDLRELARDIVGGEDNPVYQSALIYDWIVGRYPWAGARDYGTIPDIPHYVIENAHGDCGQVALLYITMVRSLGIPARWESGWMLHPWDKNWHDWAETYFEGIGWVPTDVSFGRNPNLTKRTFYKTGIDMYRYATNSDYGCALDPVKRYLRCDPVDFQAGEAEWRGGNIEMTQFKSKLDVLSIEPIE